MSGTPRRTARERERPERGEGLGGGVPWAGKILHFEPDAYFGQRLPRI